MARLFPNQSLYGEGTEGAGVFSTLRLFSRQLAPSNLTTLDLFISPRLRLNLENSYKTGFRLPYQKEKGPQQGRSCHHWKGRGTPASS